MSALSESYAHRHPTGLPPFLYHGTNEDAARKALVEGLKPRGETGASNWDHTKPSYTDLVYLSRCYAPYFALNASEDSDKWGIVEIDTNFLDPELFYPDEDHLFFNDELDSEEAAVFRAHAPDNYRSMWLDSLESLGNCAYGGVIPPEAIRRIAVFDPGSNQSIVWAAIDPSITPMNHKFCGNFYADLTQWFFGGPMTPERMLNKTGFSVPDDFFPDTEESRKQQAAYDKELQDRSGLQIIERK